MPVIDYNGEPGCRTSEEVHKRFRNNWDPTSYWECSEKGVPAQMKRCKPNQLFSDQSKECVNWKEWKWTEPAEPPSRAEY